MNQAAQQKTRAMLEMKFVRLSKRRSADQHTYAHANSLYEMGFLDREERAEEWIFTVTESGKALLKNLPKV